MFITGTGAGIVAVGAVDGRPLPLAPGPVTALVQSAYAAASLSDSLTVLIPASDS